MMQLNALTLAAVNDNDYSIVWIIVGVLAIIALLLYILRR